MYLGYPSGLTERAKKGEPTSGKIRKRFFALLL